MLIVIIVILFFGKTPAPPPMVSGSLEFWGTLDDEITMKKVTSVFTDANKSIKVNYHFVPYDDYENNLLEQMAAQKPVDIFMVQNSWMPRYLDKIATSVAEALPLVAAKESFPDTVIDDFSNGDGLVGAPLFLDTLALYYNKDKFNEAGITRAPKTWSEFVDDVEILTKKDDKRRIIYSGAALGTANNVNRASDVVAALMMQGGAKMVADDQRSVAFDKSVKIDNRNYMPAEEALKFYTSFADPLNYRQYSWGPGREFYYSIDAFAYERAAMMINYYGNKSIVQNKATNLNFEIAPLPQPDKIIKEINYPNYMAVVGYKNMRKGNKAAVNRFFSWLASEDGQRAYFEATKKPPAHLSLIEEAKTNVNLEVFARQALTAKSWFQGDNRVVDASFNEMIESVVDGKATLKEAVSKAADRISASMPNKYQ